MKNLTAGVSLSLFVVDKSNLEHLVGKPVYDMRGRMVAPTRRSAKAGVYVAAVGTKSKLR
jgi:hypothetical protein